MTFIQGHKFLSIPDAGQEGPFSHVFVVSNVGVEPKIGGILLFYPQNFKMDGENHGKNPIKPY